MWIKLTVDLFFEGNRKILKDTTLWCRRSPSIQPYYDLDKGNILHQIGSVFTIEIDGYVLVLNGCGNFYTAHSEPSSTCKDNDGKSVSR